MNSNPLILHNRAHLGDLFVSRSFVRDLSQKLNGNVVYMHKYASNYLFNDICLKEFKTDAFPIDDNIKKVYSTWYAAKNHKYMEGTGCTIQTLYKLFFEMYSNLGLSIEPIENYIPSIDFKKYNLENNKRNKQNVLICNNIPLSGQSSTNDMDFFIEQLAKLCPKNTFFITNETTKYLNYPNVIYTKNILKTNNLIEISCFSKECSYVIGRASGPYTFCFIKENFDDNVKFIEITYSNFTGENFNLSNFGLKKLGYNNFLNLNCEEPLENTLNKVILELNHHG